MFIEFIYHNIIGLIISLNIFCILEYISDPDSFTLTMYNYYINIGLWLFDKVVSIKMLYDNAKTSTFISSLTRLYKKNICNIETNSSSDINETMDRIELIYDNYGNNISLDKNQMYDGTYYKKCDNLDYFKIVNLNNKQYYVGKNVENIIIPKEAPIFSMTLKYRNIEYDIYDRVRKYFVNGNILNYKFFIAFMEKYYSIRIENLHIMEDDKPIIPYTISYLNNMFSNKVLKNNETIIIDTDGFIIKPNEKIYKITLEKEQINKKNM